MSHSQLTPRQKMINMMYLVLTAILALNVSSEVLDAFKTVNDGIGVSNTSLRSKNSDLYTDLGKEFSNDSVKARMAFDHSQKAKELSEKLYNQLEQYKKQLIQDAGGVDPATGKIKRDDDVEVATHLFVENDGKAGKALKEQLKTTRMDLLNLVNEEDRPTIEKSLALKIDEPTGGQTWEYARFHMVPVVAAVTLLSKYQNDLLNAESHVVENLYSSINKGKHKVDRMEAKIISPSSYIMQGESYKADVMVAAYSSTQHPDVFLGQFNPDVHKDFQGNYLKMVSASDAPPLINPVNVDVEGGFGKIQMPGNATGNRKYSGVVRIKGPDNNYEFYPFEGEYQVAPKVAVVSAEKMNVLYIGLDNPVDISVPGIAQSDVSAVFEGDGRLAKNPDGSYKAFVGNPGKTKIKVSAKIAGKMMPMGEQEFRIKRIPNPLSTLDGISNGGKITSSLLAQRTGVVAKSDDFIYGDIQWQVLNYSITILMGGEGIKIDNDGPKISDKARKLIKTLKKGDGVFINYINVKGPDGKARVIAPLAYEITGH